MAGSQVKLFSLVPHVIDHLPLSVEFGIQVILSKESDGK